MENKTVFDIDKILEESSEQDKIMYYVVDSEFKLIDNLIKERERQGLKQVDIAIKTGLSKQAVSRLEKHRKSPSILTLIKYLLALNIDINSLFTKDEI